MKKVLAIVLALVLVTAASGCTAKPPAESSKPQPGTSAPAPGSGTVTETNLKLGMGSITSLGSSKSATTDDGASAQADTTYCSVMLDDAGKIASIYFDVVQAKVAFDTNGKLKTDITQVPKTKRELGNDYNMKAASPIGKEWFEQVNALQDYMVGKKVDEIKNFPLKDEDGKRKPDVAELNSSCTIDISNLIKAADMAIANAK